MRSIYLIISFIAVAVFFFYFINSFILTVNFPGAETAASPSQAAQRTGNGLNATGTKNFTPGNFNGPTGQPHIIGPQGPPPNY